MNLRNAWARDRDALLTVLTLATAPNSTNFDLAFNVLVHHGKSCLHWVHPPDVGAGGIQLYNGKQ